ncbi:MAG: hypothetical protein ACRDHF_10530 [Tepidiformaceae bacterium]
MRECPWCGHMNLNVYGYCQRCGRGFDGPENPEARLADRPDAPRLRFWPFSRRRTSEE